jgi:hypothetical protein
MSTRKKRRPAPEEFVLPPDISCVGALDGGVSGGFTGRLPDGTWDAHPVVVAMERGRRVLDVLGNLQMLRSFAERAGGIDRVLIVYEAAGQNQIFGWRNSFVIGRNDEFWRVLLTLGGFRYASVHPNTWQTACGIKSTKRKDRKEKDTKPKALAFVRKHCGALEWLDKFTKVQQSGIVDAMCIALWATGLRGPAVAP